MKRDKLFPKPIHMTDLLNDRYINRKPIYDFLVSVANEANGDILDFGCGSMQYKELFANCNTYIGLDVEEAKTNGFFAEGIVYYDGRNIPFEDNTFDTVIAIEVLEHIEDVDFSLVELFRVLKPGGRLIFTVPMAFPLHMEPWDYRRFTKHGVGKLLEKHCFQNIIIESSTSYKNALRRMNIIYMRQKGKMKLLTDLYVVFSNIMFIINHNNTENSKFTVGYLVKCEKNENINISKQ